MKRMKESDRQNLEAERVRRYKANGISETEAAARAKKDVRQIELNEARREMREIEATPRNRIAKRKELYMRAGMSATEADIAARGRTPGGLPLIDG